MKMDRIANRNFFGKQISSTIDLSVDTKLEFFDEHQRSSRPKVIRVEFAGETAKHVLVKRPSQDERRQGDSNSQ